jgi:hypothetical protein
MVTPRKTMSRLSALFTALLLTLGVAAVAVAAPARHTVPANVTVTFTDKTLRVSPTTPSSGETTFVVRNLGKKAHVLVVKGPGINAARSPKLAAGSTGKLTVTLRPGAYVLSDPIGLGEYNVMFLDVIRSAAVHAKGDGSVVAPPVEVPPMCGQYFTP